MNDIYIKKLLSLIIISFLIFAMSELSNTTEAARVIVKMPTYAPEPH